MEMRRIWPKEETASAGVFFQGNRFILGRVESRSLFSPPVYCKNHQSDQNIEGSGDINGGPHPNGGNQPVACQSTSQDRSHGVGGVEVSHPTSNLAEADDKEAAEDWKGRPPSAR